MYLRLGEPSGTNANDETANNNDGTYVNTPTLGVAGALAGDADTAVTFNPASSQHVTVNDHATLDFGNGPFSLEAWYKPTDFSADATLIWKDTNAYRVVVNITTGTVSLVKEGVAVLATSTVALTAGQWNHVAVTRSGSSGAIYINGVDVTGAWTDQTFSDTTAALNIGRRGFPAGQYARGGLDEVAAYPLSLSAPRVLYHFQAGTGTLPGPPRAVHVREKPPLRQSIDAVTPSGRHFRWGEDEPDPANVFRGLRHSSTMPGGFESCDVTLPRKPGIDYSDLERLTTIRVLGASGTVVGEYRLERAPRTSGNEMSVSPSAVGWQAHLDDNKSAREIYRGIDLGGWGEPSVTGRLSLIAAGNRVDSMSVLSDQSGGAPSVVTELTGPWTAGSNPRAEAWYRPGVAIGSVYYAWKRSSSINNADTNYSWSIFASTTDNTGGSGDSSGNLLAAGPGSGTLTATDTDRKFLRVQLAYNTGTGNDLNREIYWTTLAVYGRHGLTVRGTEPAAGLYASDVVTHAVQTWAPLLQIKADSVQQSGFLISHLVFLEPTTAGEIVRQASRFNLPDWGVWEGREFVWTEQGARAKRWRARIAPSELEETGPQADRLWESILVSYQDVDGTTRTVGPPGSGADTESTDLKDSDPDNPANQLGIVRRDLLQMGVSTAAGATEVGRQFLERSRLLDSSGRATVRGWVEDDRGVLHPYFDVRAGDEITFVDASDKSYRRIVRADHDRDSRSCTVDLDSPPEGLEQLLERLNVVLVPLGVGS